MGTSRDWKSQAHTSVGARIVTPSASWFMYVQPEGHILYI